MEREEMGKLVTVSYTSSIHLTPFFTTIYPALVSRADVIVEHKEGGRAVFPLV